MPTEAMVIQEVLVTEAADREAVFYFRQATQFLTMVPFRQEGAPEVLIRVATEPVEG